MRHLHRIVYLLPLLFLTGCDVGGMSFDLASLGGMNWQTIALGAILYLAYRSDSTSQLGKIATMAKQILQGLRILPPDDSKEAAGAKELAELAAKIFAALHGQPLAQAAAGQLLNALAGAEPVLTSAPVEVSLNQTLTEQLAAVLDQVDDARTKAAVLAAMEALHGVDRAKA